MAAIRHALQQDLFRPNDEALYAVVNVAKQGTGKKKKTSFLCLAVTKEKPFEVRLYKVQKSDKEVYKKKQSWSLTDLKVVDGKHDPESPDFDLHFEKCYKWAASREADKNEFIETLWMLSERYLTSKKPSFKNVAPNLMDIDLSGRFRSNTARSQQSGQDMTETTGDEYTNLTQKEERDLEKMLSQFSDALTNVEVFTDQLSKELQELEYKNITALMGSATQAKDLLHLIDKGLDELDILDDQLSTYEALLQRVRDQMGVMEYDDNRFEIERANNKKLLEEVKHIVVTLDISKNHVRMLKEGDLYNPVGLAEVVSAAKILLEAVQAPFSPGIRELKAVHEQFRYIEGLKNDFATRFSLHLDKFISQHCITDRIPVRSGGGDLVLSSHDAIHRDFEPYAELMGWMKELDVGKYEAAKKLYADSFSKMYEKEIREFLEFARLKCASKSKGPRGASSVHSLNSQEVKNSPLLGQRKRGTILKRSPSKESINSVNSIESSQSVESVLPTDKFGRFERVFDAVLSELEPYVLAEQDFCLSFFHLKMPVEDYEQQEMMRQDSQVSEIDGASISRSKAPPKPPDEVKDMMNALFPTLVQEMQNFLTHGDKLDSYNTMYMIVRMSNQAAHLISSQATGAPASFLGTLFANWLVCAKRLFDTFIKTLKQQIEDTKVNKKHRCGILPFVTKFEEFSRIAESIFKQSERRSDIDKAYNDLIEVIFRNIERVAMEHEKTPLEVVLFENYHSMSGYITSLRNPSLEQGKREAKRRYQTAVVGYINNRLGKPMTRLSIFFEGVEDRIASGVKPEDIGYQLDFNQQDLKNIIKEYPAKEVKKGLEQLYKKVEKHVTVEGLKQVVWHNMQEEFVKQYQRIQDLIAACYPGSQIHLLVTLAEILEFFSSIAQLH